MADEQQGIEPEQTEDPATAYQPPATVVTVYDRDGREHFAAATSPFVVDGLAAGTLTTDPPRKTDGDAATGGGQSTEEVPSGAQTGSAGDDQQPGATNGSDGPDNGAADSTGASDRRRTGKA
ncbi:hypothetical protein ACQPXB_35900 [Amycolatopsis sp. CA-161197]|uniref:hypothetical protein n=1 Tax=Amycolatopsis sp. CA-161197 TaxID=3239922 RepID=UPI003D8BC4CA